MSTLPTAAHIPTVPCPEYTWTVKQWDTTYGTEQGDPKEKQPQPKASAAGLVGSMEIAMADKATNSSFTYDDPEDAGYSLNFDNVYSSKHALKDTMSQIVFGTYKLSDSYKPKKKPPPPAPQMWKEGTTHSSDIHCDPKSKAKAMAELRSSFL